MCGLYMADTTRRMGVFLLCCLLGGALVAGTAGSAAAQSDVQIDTNADYDGSEADPPATQVSVVVEPTSGSVTNFTITLQGTSQSFVAFETFDLSTSPAGISVNRRGDGQFFVEELSAGERVEIVFDVYPRSIAADELEVATVTVEGQNLQQSETVRADLSGSSYHEVQSLQNWRLVSIGLAVLLLLSLGGLVGVLLRGRGGDGGSGGGGGIGELDR
jgi:hypothetical protein